MKNFALISILALALPWMSACSQKKTKPDTYPALTGNDKSTALSNDLGSSDAGNALGLASVHFAFDSTLLDAAGKAEMRKNAAILKSNPAVKIQIEGHCDQQGGIQYNIALGERRAIAMKHFLVDQGISGGRITTISFGKEHLIDTAETEEAYAKNRRANFVITHGLASLGSR